jgi:hypothetical protein
VGSTAQNCLCLLCTKHSTYTDQGQGTCLTALKPTSPRNLLSPALLPQCVGLPEVVKIQPLILPKRTPHTPTTFSNPPLPSAPSTCRLNSRRFPTVPTSP